MPTYYNGKEITPTSKLSGLSLVGISSITIGGKVITLSIILSMYIYGNGSYPDDFSACMLGPGGSPTKVYIQDNGGGNYALFYDSGLTSPVNPGFYWSDDTTNIAGGIGPSSISVTPRGLSVTRCR
jgi:hypothetical protein